MKKTKKLFTLFMTLSLTICFLFPSTVKASDSSIPTSTFDFYYEGISIYDEIYMGGEYSFYRFEPYNGSLTVKFDAECSLSPSYSYSVSLIDGATNKVVQSTTLRAINNQYRTFNNLTSHSYYLKFAGNDNIIGQFFISKNGIFN